MRHALHLTRDLRSAGPGGVEDVFDIGFARKQIIGFIDHQRRLLAVNEAVDARPRRLGAGKRFRQQKT